MKKKIIRYGDGQPKPSKFNTKLRELRLTKFKRQETRFNKLTDELLVSEQIHLKSLYNSQNLFLLTIISVSLFVITLSSLFLLLQINFWGKNFSAFPAVIISYISVTGIILITFLVIGTSEAKTYSREILVIEEIRKKRNI